MNECQPIYKAKERRRPGVSELCDYKDRQVFVCGNGVSKSSRIWCMDWKTGQRIDAKPATLIPRHPICEAQFVSRFQTWCEKGNADAMWWLAWWFEGVNHRKSVWYYVAALRADPVGHGWAQSRIMADARYAAMCEGLPTPDISFLASIPEMMGHPIGIDWRAALAQTSLPDSVA